MKAVEYVLGLLIVLITIAGTLFVLVLPRQPFGIERLTLLVNRTVRLIFIGLSRLASSYERKDALLAPTAPVALLGQILVWAASLILGFGIMLMPTTHSWWLGLEQSTTALFTVGAIHEGGRANTGIDIWAGATWVIVVALQIAYLPTLYGAFSRREALVAMLESRAGAPAWGPELLARHQLVGITDTLADLYKDWELWSADVAESHSTYPILLLFRSPEPWLSWLVGLLAVLDAAALQLALSPSTAPSQARLCLRMGFTLTNRIATTLGWEVNFDPRPDEPIQLSYEEFAQAVALLERSGFPVERSAEEAWPDFHGWRVNYEESMYHLTDRLIAPPAKWSGGRRHLREAVVEPHRPPHRHPGSNPAATFEEPLAVATTWGLRRRRRRARRLRA
ncbi:MAG: hypothetical protein KGI65_04145 [Acidobacteriota bacterium]|nr:hypothetical protein [Acidobacteriota bacterium]MDE3030793.1 hypothetical protein [Acidobacteriota bacterium]MDE3138696.1 hypothetical protein [Acidobacteriota bacterium]